METSVQSFIELCQWDSTRFFIFSDNVFGALIYYSHLFSLALSLIIGIFVFLKNKKSLLSRLLFLMTFLFAIWTFFDLIVWATEKPEFTMFFWSGLILIEPFIYAISLYFVSVFVTQKDITFKNKLWIFLPLLPIVILLPTNFVLDGYNLTNCYREAVEGPIAIYYVYLVESIYAISILLFLIGKYRQVTREMRSQIILIGIGITLFLLSFISGNIIGSLTENWTLAQIGLFGMPIFVAFLAYIIVKFKSFNIKLIWTQVLVFALGFLVLAILFIRNIENVRIVVIFTLLFVIILGYSLIKSVKKEVEQRERLETLRLRLEQSNLNLEVANEKLKGLDQLKTEFVSLASHQLRSPLTAIKGYTSMLIQGDYGEMDPRAKETVDRIMESSNNLTLVVEDLLNVSKIEAGGMKYEMIKFDFSDLVISVVKELSITAEKKGLKLISNIKNDTKYFVKGDKEKLRQVILNLTDNSMKYTKEGEINVGIKNENSKIILFIKDTGMGIEKGKEEALFEKFSRGEGTKTNASGSGLGLYLVREIMKAHGGRVWVESDGLGKGSTFFVEIAEAK